MQVIVSSELSGSDVIMMSWVAWYNLDGRFLDEDPVVSVKVGMIVHNPITLVTRRHSEQASGHFPLSENVSRVTFID